MSLTDNKPCYISGRGRSKAIKSNFAQIPGLKFHQTEQNTSMSIPQPKSKISDSTNKIQTTSDKEYNKIEDNNHATEDSLVTSTLKNYMLDQHENGDSSLDKTKHYIERFVSDTDDPCIVCLEDINRTDKLWSCNNCYASYHLQCIQLWIRETLQQRQLRLADDEAFPNLVQPRAHVEAELERRRCAEMVWPCPTCRFELPQSATPQRYKCFCGKVEDPAIDPWILPHSCGNRCNRALGPTRSYCEHKCLLLCHPGPCPPCPQVLKASCYCTRGGVRQVRCGQRDWSCGTACGRLLSCGQHQCRQECHPGSCPTCPETSLQRCLCGSRKILRPCSETQWQCDKVCSRVLECGQHTCQEVCHRGVCPPCPTSGTRTCPCGKTPSPGPISCTENVSPCSQTCGKSLACSSGHRCQRPCHVGPCDSCRETVLKTCRCGQSTAKVPCTKPYICASKCLQMRDCGRHPCKRKCCPVGTKHSDHSQDPVAEGDNLTSCQSCTQVCNRPLACGNHKCESVCHRGPCYPCTQTVTIKCPCGGTQRRLACGVEKNPKFKTLACKKDCPKKSTCRHTNVHRCHDLSQLCPRCPAQCDSKLSCGHTCSVKCHDAVPTKIRQDRSKLAGPWELEQGKDNVIRLMKEPCPSCQHPVPIKCKGEHETYFLPCSEMHPLSCGRKCGRSLACRNHTCSLECHSLSLSCEDCHHPCTQVRPPNCAHPCPLSSCHPGSCPPCTRLVPTPCHCTALILQIACNKMDQLATTGTPQDRERLLACPGPCPGTLRDCGHPCPSTCHSGPCTTDKCSTKVPAVCKCGARRLTFACWRLTAGVVSSEVHCLPDKCHTKRNKSAPTEKDIAEDEPKTEESVVKVRHSKHKNRKQRQEELDATVVKKSPVNWALRCKYSIPFVFAIVALLIVVWAFMEAKQM